MIPGFDCKRPKREDYERFLKSFCEGLETLGKQGVSFMVYGSVARGDHDPGRSDIDGTIVMPDDVVTDKSMLQEISRIFADSMIGLSSFREGKPHVLGEVTYIPTQFSVVDLTTMQDGRFNPYDPSFYPYMDEEGKILVGPDHRKQFRYEHPEKAGQHTLTFNLRKSRQGLLYAEFNRRECLEEFVGRFAKSLDAISTGAKRIVLMHDGQVYKSRFSMLKRLSELFPELDLTPLEEIRALYKDHNRMDNLYRSPRAALIIWNRSTTFLEKLVLAYIRKFPRDTK